MKLLESTLSMMCSEIGRTVVTEELNGAEDFRLHLIIFPQLIKVAQFKKNVKIHQNQ